MQYDTKFATSPILITDKDYEFSVVPELTKENIERMNAKYKLELPADFGVSPTFNIADLNPYSRRGV